MFLYSFYSTDKIRWFKTSIWDNTSHTCTFLVLIPIVILEYRKSLNVYSYLFMYLYVVDPTRIDHGIKVPGISTEDPFKLSCNIRRRNVKTVVRHPSKTNNRNRHRGVVWRVVGHRYFRPRVGVPTTPHPHLAESLHKEGLKKFQDNWGICGQV